MGLLSWARLKEREREREIALWIERQKGKKKKKREHHEGEEETKGKSNENVHSFRPPPFDHWKLQIIKIFGKISIHLSADRRVQTWQTRESR